MRNETTGKPEMGRSKNPAKVSKATERQTANDTEAGSPGKLSPYFEYCRLLHWKQETA